MLPALQLAPPLLSRRLLDLQNTTGYEILQKQGQRIFGGPPPGWTGAPPGCGTEVYCYRIPRDCFEDELVLVFAAVGRIYELRQMIEFSGTNRTYCNVRYCEEQDAAEAVRRLHNYRIRPCNPLAVTISVDYRRLTAQLVPPPGRWCEQEVAEELGRRGVEGVSHTWLGRAGALVLEFATHRLAALARRQLVPGSLRLWGGPEVRQVGWAVPEADSAGTGGRVLCARGVPFSLGYGTILDIFNQLSGGQVETVVRAGGLVVVTLATGHAVELARHRSEGLELEGRPVEVTEWREVPRRRLERGPAALLRAPGTGPLLA